MENQEPAIQEPAIIVAAQVASEAARVARDVAQQATITAQKVAESVLVYGEALKNIREDIAEIKIMLDKKYVTVEAFDPVKRIVYGLVGTTLLSLAGAVIALVLK